MDSETRLFGATLSFYAGRLLEQLDEKRRLKNTMASSAEIATQMADINAQVEDAKTFLDGLLKLKK